MASGVKSNAHSHGCSGKCCPRSAGVRSVWLPRSTAPVGERAGALDPIKQAYLPSQLADVYMSLGDRDRVFYWLGQGSTIDTWPAVTSCDGSRLMPGSLPFTRTRGSRNCCGAPAHRNGSRHECCPPTNRTYSCSRGFDSRGTSSGELIDNPNMETSPYRSDCTGHFGTAQTRMVDFSDTTGLPSL